MASDNGSSTAVASDFTIPQHVAVIMDGNGRWARRRRLPRIEGHRAGAKSVRMIIEEARRLGVRYLTLFAFSTENWKRPADEVSALMRLLRDYIEKELEALLKNGIRLRPIGDLERLPDFVRDPLLRAAEGSSGQSEMQLLLAISYGGREEILSAVRHLAGRAASGELEVQDIDEECFRSALYAPDVPDPELLIRTSGENRISNFLLWQLAYSEIVMPQVYWPEFTKEVFHDCLRDFSKRQRRFGMTGEQALVE